MKAIVVREFGGPEVLTLDTAADPTPGPGEVTVRVRAAGVNPFDAYMRTGTYAIRPDLPYIPGADAAGEVAEVGPGVTHVTAGARVYVYGTTQGLIGAYAAAVTCPARRVFPLPDRVSFAQGAAVGVPYTTAYRALFQRGTARPGEVVLIHGATGGVGLAAVQLAHHAGLFVIGTGGTAGSLDVVRQHGADVVVSHLAPDYREAIRQATAGRGVDLILEMAAHLNLDHDLTLLAPQGRVVVIGSRGRIEIDPRHAMNRDAAIFGMVVFNAAEADVTRIHAAIGAGLANGTLQPVVREEWPLGEAARAHRDVMAGSDEHFGKIVLVP